MGPFDTNEWTAPRTPSVGGAAVPPFPRRIRVLIVDDDPQAIGLVEPALASAPFEADIEAVATAGAGLNRIKANQHDIYLVDYRLPDSTGLALIHEAHAAGIERPFILITGCGDGHLDEAALREGAADYLEKDLLGRYLERSIRYALRDWIATQDLRKRYEDAWTASVRDALTGCFSRKYALEAMERELRRSSRLKAPLCVVLFDLDRFKAINDRLGHLCGDAVLRAVGSASVVLRGSDLMCRYGGDEFLIVLPDTPEAGARCAVQTLRQRFEQHPVHWKGESIPIHASFGITATTPGELDVAAIIERADAALYEAKKRGRDGYWVYSAGSDPETATT